MQVLDKALAKKKKPDWENVVTSALGAQLD